MPSVDNTKRRLQKQLISVSISYQNLPLKHTWWVQRRCWCCRRWFYSSGFWQLMFWQQNMQIQRWQNRDWWWSRVLDQKYCHGEDVQTSNSPHTSRHDKIWKTNNDKYLGALLTMKTIDIIPNNTRITLMTWRLLLMFFFLSLVFCS